MRIAGALEAEAGASNVHDNGDFYSETTERQTITSVNQTTSFNDHSRTDVLTIAQSTPLILHICTDIATSPLKTPSKNRILDNTSTSPLCKGNVLFMDEITPKQTLSKPLSYEEDKMLTHLVKRKMNT